MDLPNINYDNTGNVASIVMKVINDKLKADNTKTETTITHPVIPPPARPNPNNSDPAPVWARWSEISNDQPKRWPSLDDNVVQTIIPTADVLVDSRVQIQITAGQSGFSIANFRGLTKAKILIVFEKL